VTDIEVVDIATHPADRVPLLHAALNARKHVLSQKPFVLDLDEGERLVDSQSATASNSLSTKTVVGHPMCLYAGVGSGWATWRD
jgi:predicted dehydrogenase